MYDVTFKNSEKKVKRKQIHSIHSYKRPNLFIVNHAIAKDYLLQRYLLRVFSGYGFINQFSKQSFIEAA